jgi:4'-phosphopantetheinyl transferase
MTELGDWRSAPDRPHLTVGAADVWRISIEAGDSPGSYWRVLSPAEQARALRLQRASDRAAYVLAHGATRNILAAYAQMPASELRFETGEFGKPALAPVGPGPRLEFNLSHSGRLALLAVALDRAVGIDIARWEPHVDHAGIAERYFSPAEREALRALAGAPEPVVKGFFSAWSRKEAYLKATGHGVSRGLEHFDVSLAPGEPAALIADRLDESAPSRWTMVGLEAGVGYSATLVVASPIGEIRLFDAPEGAPARAAGAPSASRHAAHASP